MILNKYEDPVISSFHMVAISLFLLALSSEHRNSSWFHDERRGRLCGGTQVHGNLHRMQVRDDKDVYNTTMALTSGFSMVLPTASSPCHLYAKSKL